MNFVTLFPETENVHLVKDVGMIGYILHEYYGYNSKIVCYKNSDEYIYLDNEVKGLKIDFLKKHINSKWDGFFYLFKHAKNIDILHIIHLCRRSILWIFIYKTLNPKGKVYLKLDANYRIKHYKFHKISVRSCLRRWLINKCDLISVETVALYRFIKAQWKIDIKYIPNGFYDGGNRIIVEYEQKENIICTVGRIGAREKATEILLEGFKLAANDISNWKLKIIGPIEEKFQKYIEKFFYDNPELRDRIIFTGPIYDRNILDKEYQQAKIFCLTSRLESFGLVFLEAMKNGCYIITSNVESAVDITKSEYYGKIFPVDDAQELAKRLVDACGDEETRKSICRKIQDFAYENFYWPNICKDIDANLKL